MTPSRLQLALVILASVLLAASPAVAAPGGTSWTSYKLSPSDIAVYDMDLDGILEVLALPGTVIDNYVAVRSPYPPGYSKAYVASSHLVLYDPGTGRYAVFSGLSKVHEGIAPERASPAADLSGRVLKIGNILLSPPKTVALPVSEGVPVYSDAYGPGIVAREGDALVAVFEDAKIVLSNSTDVVPVAAYMVNATLYVLGRSAGSGTVYLAYNVEARDLKIYGIPASLDRVWFFDPMGRAFIASSGNLVYRVGPGSITVEFHGTVVARDERHLYIVSSGKLTVYDPVLRRVVDILPLPVEESRIRVYSCRYPVAAVATEDAVYVTANLPEPVIDVAVPFTAYAGQEVRYSVRLSNAVDYKITVDGVALDSLEGTVKFDRAGVYNFTVSASNGIVTRTVAVPITVLPRTITLSLRVKGEPVAYQEATVTVEATDGISGEPASAACEVTVGGATYRVMAWEELRVRMAPPDPSTPYVQVTMVCGDDRYYARTTYIVSVPVRPAEPRLHVEYLGAGKLLIGFIYVEGGRQEFVPGNVTVIVDESLRKSGRNPVIVTVSPGEHVVRAAFTPLVPAFSQTEKEVAVRYYYSLEEVPEEEKHAVIVADRVVNVTTTVTTTKVKVVTVTAASSRTFSYKLLLPVPAVAAAAGIAAYLVIRRRQLRAGAA